MRRSSELAGRGSASADRWIPVVAAVVVVVVVALFQLSWDAVVGLWGPLALIVAMVMVTAALVRGTARISDVPRITTLLVLSLGIKAVGTAARYIVAADVYDGSADAFVYQGSAETLARSIHEGVWSLDGTPIASFPGATRSIAWLLGGLYSVVGPSQLLGFAVFSWASWVGLVLFYRAFRLWLPGLGSRAFALLLFLLPSLFYWPSSVGKESIMVFLLGLATLGLARLVTVQGLVRGAVMVGMAAAGIWWIRPHMVLLLLAAAVVALLVQNPSDGRARSRALRGLLLVLLVPALVVSIGQVNELFGDQDDDAKGIEAVLDTTAERTARGGSSFEAEAVRSPLDVPVATVDVLFRPFPWQARGIPVIVASLEGVFLAGLMVARWRALLRLPRLAWTRSAVAFALSFSALFVIAFSNISNAGILARQRTQLMPFLLIALGAAMAWSGSQGTQEQASVMAEERAGSPRLAPSGGPSPRVLAP